MTVRIAAGDRQSYDALCAAARAQGHDAPETFIEFLPAPDTSLRAGILAGLHREIARRCGHDRPR